MQVRPASFSDFPAVTSLMVGLGMSPPSERRWTELWRSNPAYRPEVPIGWVLDTPAGITGFIGNLPRQMWDGERLVVARVPTSWAVSPEARSFSLPLVVKWLRQPDAELLLNSSATPAAAALFERLDVERVPCPALATRRLWITSYAGMASGVLRRSGLGALAPLGGLLAPFDLVTRLAGSRPRGLEWRSSFAPAFDGFWATFSRRPVLQSVRDERNLDWAYGAALAESRAWLLVDPDAERVRGYAVFLAAPVRSMGLKRMKLVDFAADDDDPTPYLAAALDRCRNQGIDVIETTGFDARVAASLARSTRHRSPIEGWPAFFRDADPARAARLQSEAAWYFSAYDGDSSLW